MPFHLGGNDGAVCHEQDDVCLAGLMLPAVELDSGVRARQEAGPVRQRCDQPAHDQGVVDGIVVDEPLGC